MNAELDLFSWDKGKRESVTILQPPAQRHSETSRFAAERIKESAQTLRAKVLDYVWRQGVFGATDHEIQEALGMDPSTERPRRVELVRMGRVVDSGATRDTRSGRKATVWRVV